MSSSNSSDNPQRLTEKKKAEKELEALFQALSLQQGEVKPPPRKAPGTSGRAEAFDTNMFQVQTSEGAVVYRYDVSLSGLIIRNQREKVVDLTKRSDSSAVIADRMDQCRNAFRLIYEQNKPFFGNDRNAIFYDLQSILFSLAPLNIPPTNSSVQLIVERGDSVTFPGNLDRIIMEVKNVNEKAQIIRLDDLSAIIREENLERDRSLLNLIELVINQYPMFNDREFLTLKGSMVFFLNGADHSLPEKELDRGGTKYLASGIQKSATVIEGHKPADGSGDPKQRKIGVMLEAKHSPFHSTLPLLDCIQRHNNSSALYPNFVRGNLVDQDLNKLGKIFKKMRLDVRYPDGRSRKIELKGFSQDSATTHKIEDLKCSVADYFSDKYGPLKYPNAHLVSVKQGANWNFYPPELLFISDNQVVTAEQMDAFSKTSMIKACAVRPDRMQQENKLAAEAIHLHNSEFANGAGIRFSKNTLGVNGRVLPPPSIQYGDNNRPIRVRENEGAWRMSRFYQPAKFDNFAVYMLKTERDTQAMMNPNKFNAFVTEVQRFASRSGIDMGECKDRGTYNDFEVEDCVKYCADNNIQLCMFITPDFITNVHKIMKMCEHRYNVVTQDLKMKTAFKMTESGAAATLENYMAKTNMKLGGLNHSVECQDPEIMNELKNTMFISISTNQPGSKSITDRVGTIKNQTPGVLGFCANYGRNYNEFLGDFYYTQAYRPEFYAELRKIFALSVQRFTDTRGKAPQRIVFYYSGASEGQFEAVYKNGVPLIKKGIEEGNNGVAIPLTILAVMKVNNVRIFPKKYPSNGKDHDFNVPHGTVVDTTIVSPVFNEFYLAAHSALKGTGRIPRYTIIFDENQYSMNLLEGVTHVLSYEHQIVSRSTSLPTPVYVAEGYALRGRDVFNAESRAEGPSLPFKDNNEYDLERMSEMFNYSKTSLWTMRINA